MCQKVAVAQALLARPRLLVLDEAWTGLDQAARGTLDAAVGERLAEGGTVVFVDHDPARMADRVDERRQLAGGAVQIAAGPRDAEVPRAAQPVAGPEAASLADPASAGVTVVIELVGLEAGSLPRLGSLAGVLAVWPDPALEYETGQRLELVRLTATVALSDAILRRLLGFDGVHVLRVWPAEWPGAGQ
jgi:ABC-2 type transport system ATP-binding protein